MEILLWLVPPVVVTVLAMCWVGWVGREGRGEVDRDVAVARMAKALQRDAPAATKYAARTPERDRSSGIAVRPSRQDRPRSGTAPLAGDEHRRRAS